VILDGERVQAVLHESMPLEAAGTAAALAQVARERHDLLAYTTRRAVAEAASHAGFEAAEAQVIVIAVAGRPTTKLRVADAWLHELDRA